jgi:hypothetical protein
MLPDRRPDRFRGEQWRALGVFVVAYLLALLALACGVTVSGRIDVGPEAGTPARESPCPGGTP